MRVLSFVALILLVHTGSGCLPPQIEVEDLNPPKEVSYALDDITTMTCTDNYVVPWATAADDKVGDIKCVDDGSSNPIWSPAPDENVDGFTGTINGCVACIDGVLDCTEGTCNANGMCDCNVGFRIDNDPRVCVAITCPAPTLSNQVIEDNQHNDGPYPIDAAITVTCNDGYYVTGKDKTEVEQVLTCTDQGYFDLTLAVCVAVGCPKPDVLVKRLDPWETDPYYDLDVVATMTCNVKYVVPWATAADNNVGDMKCVDDGSGNLNWAPEPVVAGFSGTINGCVACIDGVLDCTDGTCNANGICNCKGGYEPSDDPRVCVAITCSEPDLSNQVIEANEYDDGPYPVNAAITVTCNTGYHVTGKDKSEIQQVLTCTAQGFFDQTLVGCVVCAEDSECSGGGTCTGNNLCECDAASHLVLDKTDPTTCLEVTCDNNDPCVNNGKCSVKDIKLECECQTGTDGDTCADFTNPDVCAGDPCNSDNGGTCARVSGDDVTNFNQHVCTCSNDKFSGDSCEFANNFFVWGEGLKKTGISSQSVEFGVVTAKGLTPMYIALFKVIDQDDNEYKVLLLKPDEDSLQLHVNKIDGMSTEETLEISGLSFTTTPLIVKVHIAADTKALTLTVGDESKKSITVKEITDFVIGGTGCAWDDYTCSFGKSRIFYRWFVGYFHSVSVDGRQLTYSEIKTDSSESTASTVTCADYTCPSPSIYNTATCDDTSGQIVCTCPEGYTGSDCKTLDAGISFNGYTSDFTFYSGTTVPVHTDVQTAALYFIKKSSEVGEIATLELFGCEITIRGVEGAHVEIEGNQFYSGGGVVELTFKDGKVSAGKLNVADCVVDNTPVSATVRALNLGGRDPDSDSSVTLQDSRFKGCIYKIVVNDIDIMRESVSNIANYVNMTHCTTDFDAPNPCVEANPCQNNGECSVVAADNSAACECAVPYTNDAVCTRKMFCAEGGGNNCNAEHSTCEELMTIEECNSAKSKKDELECGEDKVWYYYCACSDGWMGVDCNEEVKEPPTEAVKDDGNDTTTIIIVVVVVAVVLGVVVTVIIVKKRKSSSGNGATNGKNGDSYSPQAQEKDLEMSGKIDEQPRTTNLYDNVDVIKNPNAESADYDNLPAPQAGPSVEPAVYPPLDTAEITVEPTASEKSPSDQV